MAPSTASSAKKSAIKKPSSVKRVKPKDGNECSTKTPCSNREKRKTANYNAEHLSDYDSLDELDDKPNKNNKNSNKPMFDILEKINDTSRFPQLFVKEYKGEEINLELLQRNGFSTPLFVKEKPGLRMTVPNSSFTVSDVRHGVGGKRIIDVMDCSTQKNSQLTMKDFEEYWLKEKRGSRKLNVISLEFSLTKLDDLVEAPLVVRQLDWTENVWPRNLKDNQEDSTNDLRNMKYPKVQKYCLMSVKGCYTDFHIDFGGTSVWYHIVKGSKIFWLIPPTESNLKLFEQWTLSGKQNHVFFGDLVEKCAKIQLKSGNTFFIPSGWIHAVYTPSDSLVFGGNFLHSLAIDKQIRIAQIEEITHVPHKFRFPFFNEVQWYVLDKYVYHLLGRSHMTLFDAESNYLYGCESNINKKFQIFEQQFIEQEKELNKKYPDLSSVEKDMLPCINQCGSLTRQELFGLKAIVIYIHALPVAKKSVPELLSRIPSAPIDLIKDIRWIVHRHKYDDPHLAVTGCPLLYWPAFKSEVIPSTAKLLSKRKRVSVELPTNQNEKCVDMEDEKRSKRVACNTCQNCVLPDCGECLFCLSQIRFGSVIPQSMKNLNESTQCRNRKCIQPVLDPKLTCSICQLDGWNANPTSTNIQRPFSKCLLVECVKCWTIVHPTCVTDNGCNAMMMNEKSSLPQRPNIWICPTCISSNSSDNSLKKEKHESSQVFVYGPDSTFNGHQLCTLKSTSDESKQTLRNQLSSQILSNVPKESILQPKFVVRPPPYNFDPQDIYDKRKQRGMRRRQMTHNNNKTTPLDLTTSVGYTNSNMHSMEEENFVELLYEGGIMMPIFRMLNEDCLKQVSLVCKAWYGISRSLIQSTVNLTNVRPITWRTCSIVVRKQPTKLILNHCYSICKKQLNWILCRCPQLRSLHVEGLDLGRVVMPALLDCAVEMPFIRELSLSSCSNSNDDVMGFILSPSPTQSPHDGPRPGLPPGKVSHLSHLTKLNVSNTNVSNVTISNLLRTTPNLEYVDISNCLKINDQSIDLFKGFDNLKSILLHGCRCVTDTSVVVTLTDMKLFKHLETIDLTDTAVSDWAVDQLVEDRRLIRKKAMMLSKV